MAHQASVSFFPQNPGICAMHAHSQKAKVLCSGRAAHDLPGLVHSGHHCSPRVEEDTLFQVRALIQSILRMGVLSATSGAAILAQAIIFSWIVIRVPTHLFQSLQDVVCPLNCL